jgi:hypothetical protein
MDIMGIYIHIRGWIEADTGQWPIIQSVISSYEADGGTYARSWHLPSSSSGYMNYAFFGCPVRESEIPEFRQLLERLAAISSRDGNDIDFVEGRFSIEHELSDQHPAKDWILREGLLHERLAPVST